MALFCNWSVAYFAQIGEDRLSFGGLFHISSSLRCRLLAQLRGWRDVRYAAAIGGSGHRVLAVRERREA